MKKVVTCFLVLSLLSLGLTSCSDDDENFPYTGENGRLSRAQYGDDTFYFSYIGNKISQIRINKTFVSDFMYENNELSKISTHPIDDRIADGNSYSSFSRDGNVIRVENWGEPSVLTYVMEIELDENDIPVRITELGGFPHPLDLETEQTKGKYYALLDFDPDTKNLLKQELYLIETSEKVASYEFEYNETPGVMSKIDLPLWFFAYKCYAANGFGINYSALYFNHSNNLIKALVSDSENEIYSTYMLQYEYNKAGFPIKLFSASTDADVTIWY